MLSSCVSPFSILRIRQRDKDFLGYRLASSHFPTFASTRFNSKYADRAKLSLQDPRIARCVINRSRPPSVKQATRKETAAECHSLWPTTSYCLVLSGNRNS